MSEILGDLRKRSYTFICGKSYLCIKVKVLSHRIHFKRKRRSRIYVQSTSLKVLKNSFQVSLGTFGLHGSYI